MSRYRKIDIRIWDDEKFRKLSNDSKFFFLYLLTSPHSTAWGAYVIDDLYIQADLNWNQKKILNCWEELANCSLTVRCERTRLVCFPKWFKYNRPVNQKSATVCINGLASLPNSQVLSDYCVRSDWVSEQLSNRNLTVSELLGSEQEQKQEQKQEQEQYTRHFDEQSVEVTLSKYLFSFIFERNPSHKEPNYQVWAKEIDKMIRLDNRQPNEIRDLIDWSQKDEFWQNNILSTKKLRDQFDQMAIRRKKEIANGDKGSGRTGVGLF